MRTFVTVPLRKLAGCRFRHGLGLGLLILAAGCSGTPRWGAWSSHPTSAQIVAVLGQLDSYVYYPGYEIYFNRTKEQYVFRSDRAWVAQPEPPVDVNGVDLLASPSVAMTFSDAPERHHAAVVRAYPRYWGHPETLTALAH